MLTRMPFRKSVVLGALVIAPGLFMGGSALAQDSSPAATAGGPSEGYPVAIHAGSCDDLTAQPNFEIANAVTFGVDDDDVETIGTAGSEPAILSASATIDDSLNDLANDGNAVAVHASADDYDTVIACGTIAGIKDDGKLVIALNSTDDATVVGIAILDEDNSGVLGLGDDQVKATVYLFDTAESDSATPQS